MREKTICVHKTVAKLMCALDSLTERLMTERGNYPTSKATECEKMNDKSDVKWPRQKCLLCLKIMNTS